VDRTARMGRALRPRGHDQHRRRRVLSLHHPATGRFTSPASRKGTGPAFICRRGRRAIPTARRKAGAGGQLRNQPFQRLIDPGERSSSSAVGMPDTVGDTDYYVVFATLATSGAVRLTWAAGQHDRRPGVSAPSPRRQISVLYDLPAEPCGPGPARPWRLYGAHGRLHKAGNGNATVYWMSAGFLDRLRPDGF